MLSIHEHIRTVSGALTDMKLEPEMVRLFFVAPDNPSTETITKEGNFQWIGYELLFKRVVHGKTGPVEIKHYKYRTPLWAYGLEAPGDQIVVDSDNEQEESEDVSLEMVKRLLKKYVEKPDLYPVGLNGFYYNVPAELSTSKFDPSRWLKSGKEYSYDKFNNKFRKSGFYKVVSKSKKLENP